MKFSIITPTYNSGKYLTETIKSVVSQKGDFEFEYIIVDGGSDDETLDIIKKYAEEYPFIRWISEKDNGMYDAINKGFSMATGDIFAYINSDDVYEPKAFNTISKVFKKFPEIQWVKGITLISNEKLETIKTPHCFIFNQEWIRKGIYGRYAYFIHQDSAFWRKELWEKIGKIPEDIKLAGDYYLWTQFAKYSPLWSIDYTVSRFRKRKGQLSENMSKYRKEQEKIVPKTKSFLALKIKLFFWLKAKLIILPESFFVILYRTLFWRESKHYIDIEDNALIKREANSYIVK